MNLAKKYNFILDFDGTLVDSFALHERSLRFALSEVDLEVEKKFSYTDHLGYSTAMIAKRIGLSDSDGKKLSEKKHFLYETYLKEGRLEYMPGAYNFLVTLKLMKMKRYLATAGSKRSVFNALESLSLLDYFDDIMTANDIQNAKPAADVHLALTKRHNLNINTTVVIEDSITGITAAREAGIDVIGTYNRDIEKKVDLFVDNLGELAELLHSVK